mmetsp:Transcript_11839/g.29666  ORF Transcript_11839/g.29666 Transcript_11839/m.29666 type:complete len:208 (+) Transcript_11839:1236-1859(+)
MAHHQQPEQHHDGQDVYGRRRHHVLLRRRHGVLLHRAGDARLYCFHQGPVVSCSRLRRHRAKAPHRRPLRRGGQARRRPGRDRAPPRRLHLPREARRAHLSRPLSPHRRGQHMRPRRRLGQRKKHHHPAHAALLRPLVGRRLPGREGPPVTQPRVAEEEPRPGVAGAGPLCPLHHRQHPIRQGRRHRGRGQGGLPKVKRRPVHRHAA